MIYTTKKCPHCKRTYDRKSDVTAGEYSGYSSPFISCPHCGKIFIDTDIKELALDEKEPRVLKFYNAFWGTHIISLFLALMLIFGVKTSNYFNIFGVYIPDNYAAAFLAFAIYIVISIFVILNLDKINQNTLTE